MILAFCLKYGKRRVAFCAMRPKEASVVFELVRSDVKQAEKHLVNNYRGVLTAIEKSPEERGKIATVLTGIQKQNREHLPRMQQKIQDEVLLQNFRILMNIATSVDALNLVAAMYPDVKRLLTEEEKQKAQALLARQAKNSKNKHGAHKTDHGVRI